MNSHFTLLFALILLFTSCKQENQKTTTEVESSQSPWLLGFEKTDVNGDNAHPLFKYLKHAAPGILGTEAIKWNFTKFLVDRKGQVLHRYGSADDPVSIANDIQKALQSPK